MKTIAVAVALCFAVPAFAGDKAAHDAKTTEVAKPAAAASTTAAAAVAKVKGEGDYKFAAELAWDMPYGPQGPAFAVAKGDPKKKNAPVEMFLKFPAGFDSSWHTHDSEYTAIVVKGHITHQVQGGTEHKLAQGSWWTQPAKVNHRNTCLADGGECIIFGSMPKGHSFTPKTAEGKDVPKEKATGGSH